MAPNERYRSEATLARVYVNGEVVEVRSANPTVGQVLRKAGYDPRLSDVYRLRGPNDRHGERISTETVLHLENRQDPVYLRCLPKDTKVAPGQSGSVAPTLTTTPEDPRRALGIGDLRSPSSPGPSPPPEPPGLPPP